MTIGDAENIVFGPFIIPVLSRLEIPARVGPFRETS